MTCGCTVRTPARPHLLALLWHGRGPYEGVVLRPLADALLAAGAAVVVRDWDSTAADRGRSDLLHSLDCAQEHAGALPRVLVGWSLGGAAALSVALGAVDGTPPPAAVVALATDARSPSPLTGRTPLATAEGAARLLPTVLVHGSADDVVPAAASRGFADLARARGWPLRRHEVDTDHAGVVGTQYDPQRGLCVPATTPRSRTGRTAATSAVLEAARLAGARGEGVRHPADHEPTPRNDRPRDRSQLRHR